MTIRTRAQAASDDAVAEANDESVNHGKRGDEGLADETRGADGVVRRADAIGDLDGEDSPGKTNENM